MLSGASTPPPRYSASTSVTVGGTTTTGHGARRDTSAEMLPRSDELGSVRPMSAQELRLNH
jgi:hypothetical protein